MPSPLAIAGLHDGELGPDRALHLIVRRLQLLTRKFRPILAAGEKILVFRSRVDDDAVALRLGAALRRFGPNLLLWVAPAQNRGCDRSRRATRRGNIERANRSRQRLGQSRAGYLADAVRPCLWLLADARCDRRREGHRAMTEAEVYDRLTAIFREFFDNPGPGDFDRTRRHGISMDGIRRKPWRSCSRSKSCFTSR